ncbi:hypothetical protein NDU88_004107 [Pleurodeles waltl]|uniref:Uncharacterized protein n=1 Tax=Pleurodeles waltl TaxID=8319 RepID=A0AAV7TQY3_PLEWA|nr:hypothetical protein NDU88_004107 [Pleurodeles waltl]
MSELKLLDFTVSRELEAVDTFSGPANWRQWTDLARLPLRGPRASAGYKSRVSRLRVARLLSRVLTHRVRKENAD